MHLFVRMIFIRNLVCQEHKDNIYRRLLEEYKIKVFKIKGNIPLTFMAVTPLYKTAGHEKDCFLGLKQ